MAHPSAHCLSQASIAVGLRGLVKEAIIFDAIGDVSESSSSSELGIACGKGRRLLVGRDKGAWIMRECEWAVWRVNRGEALLSRMRWALKMG